MKYKVIIIVFLFFSISCNKYKDNEIGKPENYMLTEKKILEDCNIFQMRFKDGEYIFNFSLSGSCKGLNKEGYIEEYSKYLDFYHDSLVYKRGYIIINYYENEISNSKALQDSIISITRKNFNASVSLEKNEKNSFTIKVFDIPYKEE